MKVAVLGSGNGGCAVAFDWAQHGHDVGLFDFERFPANLAAIAARGGIRSSGQLEGFAEIDYAGHDIAQAMDGAELIFAVSPAFATAPLAEAARPHLRPGQSVVVCPSSCAGSLVFKAALGLALDNDTYNIGETSTLPYAVRVTDPGAMRVFLKLESGLSIAAVPHGGTEDLHAALRKMGAGLRQPTACSRPRCRSGQPVIHPAVTLLNAALIERTGGAFNFYEDGVTETVGRLIEGVEPASASRWPRRWA